MKEYREEFKKAILSVNRQKASNVAAAVKKQFGRDAISDQLIIPVLESMGQDWETGKAALSQVYMSGIICENIAETMFANDSNATGETLPVAVVSFEDYHSLGKRIVLAVLKANGLLVRDYGHGIQAGTLIERIVKDRIKVLLISVLMLPSALHTRKLKQALNEQEISIRIGVGGAPFRFDDQLWKKIGADAMGTTASDAVGIVRQLMEELS